MNKILTTEVLKKLDLSLEDIFFINELICRAGQIAQDIYFNSDLKVETKEAPDDLVTYADKYLSELIVHEIQNRFPSDIIISEEENNQYDFNTDRKAWVIDPIDGTDNYVKNDGQYSVMIGLLMQNRPVCGWVYSPPQDKLVLGIVGSGILCQVKQGKMHTWKDTIHNIKPHTPLKVMMGRRDRKQNPEIKKALEHYNFIEMGSLGLKVLIILEGKADVFLHACKKLKLWDTVAPTAIALAGGLEIDTLEGNKFHFSLNDLHHDQTYLVGIRAAIDEIKRTLGY
jgi:3'(2'), 5'-bisphosphate nucleotidase